LYRILITGGSGFVGSNLAHFFESDNLVFIAIVKQFWFFMEYFLHLCYI